MKISIELENKVKDISQEVRQRAKEATTWEKTITMIINIFFLEPNSFLHCMNFQIEGSKNAHCDKENKETLKYTTVKL